MKKRVLWIVNILLPEPSEALGLAKINHGGWLTGYINNLKKTDCEVFIICPSEQVSRIMKVEEDNTYYFVLPSNKLTCMEFERIIQEISPDLIHIHGTEYSHSLEMARAAKNLNVKAVVSIQGLMCECEKHYLDGIPGKYKNHIACKKIIKKALNIIHLEPQFLLLDKKEFAKKAEKEKETLNLVGHVIGRSNWDKKHSNLINNALTYYKVNEILREEFYTEDRWSYADCEKHSIFLSQANYPIKGLHVFIQALAVVKTKYPDVKAYLGGFKPFTLNNKLLDSLAYLFFEYKRLIKSQIKKYDLADNIEYTGVLDANQMKKRYLKSNVFVSASSIENGSNSVSEAMMLRVPIIASEVGGVDSVFNYGIDGLSYKFEDYQTLAEHILTMFELKDKVSVYTDKALIYANKTKDPQTNIQDLLNTYDSIITQH